MASELLVARRVLRAGAWEGSRAFGRLTLPWEERLRRRARLTLDGGGEHVLLDLPHALRLSDGDGLELTDGRVVPIAAACEAVLEIRAGSTRLERIAYHLGNRHLPIQFAADVLVVPADRLTADLAQALGADVRSARRIFDPEPGAHREHAHDG